ncbi:N-acetylglucosamine-6-phosphate deacetylase [Ideonella sp. 4Y16]|uniref:N-acetylglucosamine-6-phosphate deacetylase n=1 Tax=Ideonella alba TaxID=2824118 RepID=A0A940YFN5_9BURK|nr:N-acetylglucosamine-6-phosphate deacetylase [Ideonella alba]MBQ0933308.1 N-acetylglucosamine-6-phosphate deacetylase [Ideonella alba]MBQ0943608.1 N-acetylglucosamine-6-phosphate deacetylase [Ideonella alba]
MTLHTLHANVLTPEGWRLGPLRFDERIQAIDGAPIAQPDPALPIALPGFIDLHVHGGGGADTMEGAAAVRTLARLHARHGTTALLATTMTAPTADVQRALDGIAAAMASGPGDGARVLGVHLEGPWLSPQRLGAQPPDTHAATLAELDDFCARATLRVVTLAPEEDGHLALIPQLVARGLRVQIGHSEASYEQGVAALAAGASGFTHLFNAMSGLHHRAPGLVGAALAHAQHAELIPDGLHVHPGALLAALRAIPRVFAVTDATAAAGMPEGEFRLGRQTVHHCAGGVRLADGTLAGSALTMDRALRHLVGLGLSLAEASDRVSRFPADYLGETERGRLAPGAHADLVLLDARLGVQAVYVAGRELPR